MCFHNSLIALLPTQTNSLVLSELSFIALELGLKVYLALKA